MRPKRLVIDLLDDWSIHPAFKGIAPAVEAAYAVLFEQADRIIANAEGTLALAHRFDRMDATLLPNGVDPQRFRPVSTAVGPTTVGYIGKIGSRLDFSLIHDVTKSLCDYKFVFAGPVMDSRSERELRRMGANVTHVGDVHYSKVPELLESFDIGWIPHRVGTGEVGGDAIKLYEYRAAGLPVVATPIAGVEDRGLSCVTSVAREHHVRILSSLTSGGVRVPRHQEDIPRHHTWSYKTKMIMDAAGVEE